MKTIYLIGGTKVVLRECPNCVADAAEFLEELISTSLE